MTPFAFCCHFAASRLAPAGYRQALGRPGKRMGHAGAIISGVRGKAADKMAALRAAGATVVANIADLGQTVKKVMK